MKVCQHPNIIKIFDIFEDDEQWFIVMEYLKGSDMFDYLEKKDFQIKETRAKDLAT
jgi:serine/threonine protein kinase